MILRPYCSAPKLQEGGCRGGGAMQLKSLRLGAMTLACAVLLAAAPPPHAAAQAAEDTAVPFDHDGLFSKPTLDLVDMGRRTSRLRHLSEVFMGRIPKQFAARFALIEEFESGDPRIMFETALRLRDGDGLPQHREAALTWLERAGDHGVPEGYHEAARMLLDEPGTSYKGEDLLKRAARYGVAAAQKDLSMRQLARVRQNDNYDNRPYAWLLLAQANGAEVSAAEFAAARDYLPEVAREDARASVQWALGKARLPASWPLVRDDDAPADIFDEDLRAALQWLECGRILSIIDDARQAGIAAAEYELGELHEEGTCVDQDAAKALDRYTAAANGGAMQSALRLGLLYYDGRGAARDLTAARFWFKAAALNLASSTFSLSAKEKLREIEYDMPRTDGYRPRKPPHPLVVELEWVAEIEGGDPRTLFETALRVRDGRGLPRVRQAAITWLSWAGSRGLPEAYYELGRTYLDSPLYPVHLERGARSLARAGRDGYVPAQVELGRRYAAGDQVQQWDHAAYVWLLMAAGNGAEVAALLEEVSGRLSEEERQTARAEAEKGTYYPLIWR